MADQIVADLSAIHLSKTPSKKEVSGGRTRKSRRGTIPAGYTITEKHLADAQQIGWSTERAHAEFPHFADHHRAKGNVLADWNAAWRTWCRRGVKFDAEKQQRDGASGGRVTGLQSAYEGMRESLYEGGEEQ